MCNQNNGGKMPAVYEKLNHLSEKPRHLPAAGVDAKNKLNLPTMTEYHCSEAITT